MSLHHKDKRLPKLYRFIHRQLQSLVLPMSSILTRMYYTSMENHSPRSLVGRPRKTKLQYHHHKTSISQVRKLSMCNHNTLHLSRYRHIIL